MFILLIFSISYYLTNVNTPIFILVDLPIIGRVTAMFSMMPITAGRDSPSPLER